MNQDSIDFSQPIKRRDGAASPSNAPKLRDSEHLVLPAGTAREDDYLVAMPDRKTIDQQPPQQLLAVRTAALFWKSCEGVFEFPSPNQETQVGQTLRLEDMLAEIRIVDVEKAKVLFLQALSFLPKVDPAFGRGPGGGEPPFETLKHRSDMACELRRHTTRLLREVRGFYASDPADVLSTFIRRVEHYRTDEKAPRGEPLEACTLLASMEMIYDAGERPLMRAPETQRSKEDVAPVPARAPKRIDYGREPVVSGEASQGARNTPEPDPEKATWLSASARAEQERADLERREQDEFAAFKSRVVSPVTTFAMYGRMIGPKGTNQTYGDLFPDADPEIRFNTIPSPLQELTVALSTWARAYTRYGQQYLKEDKLVAWMNRVDPTVLEREERVRRDTVSVYQRIITLANELPLTEDFRRNLQDTILLDEDQHRVLKQIAPQAHFNGRDQHDADDPIFAATLKARRDEAINERIRIEARKIDDLDEHLRLKGLTDRAARYRIAEEIARDLILNPKKLP